jgi:hypothetical protein
MSDDPAETPLDLMKHAVADLWSAPIRFDDNSVVYYDHYGHPTRIRHEEGAYFVAWPLESGGEVTWNEDPHGYDSPREAALHAFQGPEKGRF